MVLTFFIITLGTNCKKEEKKMPYERYFTKYFNLTVGKSDTLRYSHSTTSEIDVNNDSLNDFKFTVKEFWAWCAPYPDSAPYAWEYYFGTSNVNYSNILTQKSLFSYSKLIAWPGDIIGPYLHDTIENISWKKELINWGGLSCFGIASHGNLWIYLPIRLLKENQKYFGYLKVKEISTEKPRNFYIERSVICTEPDSSIIVEE